MTKEDYARIQQMIDATISHEMYHTIATVDDLPDIDDLQAQIDDAVDAARDAERRADDAYTLAEDAKELAEDAKELAEGI